MKGFIGSANIDTNSRLCMASAVAGYKRAFGADTVPNDYTDLEQAELIVLVGSNLAWCHPVLFQRVSAAKAANPKLRVVLIDPRRTQTAEIADLFLQLRPGTDVVLFNGLAELPAARGCARSRVSRRAHGGVRRRAALRERKRGVDPRGRRGVRARRGRGARVLPLVRAHAATVTAFSQGVNQSTSGTDKVNAIINVHLATGRIGKPGMGPFSLTGQPNAMGGREVGGLANQLAAHMDFAPENVDRVAPLLERAARSVAAGSESRRPVRRRRARARSRPSGSCRRIPSSACRMPSACGARSSAASSSSSPTACATRTRRAARTCCCRRPTWGEKSGTVTNSERRISRQRTLLAARPARRSPTGGS